jgi:L-ascorbate metabolism protein UlaG (beta-lactamase superfamily)
MLYSAHNGVAYIAIGENAESEYVISLSSFQKYNNLPIICYTTKQANASIFNAAYTPAQISRIAKLTLFQWSNFENTLYLDADTRVFGDITAGFAILDDGFDLVIAASNNQGSDLFWHTTPEDRAYTFNDMHTRDMLQLQAGMFFVARNDRTLALFDTWLHEWERFKTQDQAALIRALRKNPVKIHLLGRAWNDSRRGKGAVIEHWFGRAR